MNFFIKLALFCVTLVSAEELSGKELSSFRNLDQELAPLMNRYAAEDILVLCDVNYTLLFVDHPAMYIPNIKKHASEMQKIMSGRTLEDQNILIGRATKAEPQRLVEECIPQTLKSLQEKGTKVMALSAALSGDLYGVDSRKWFNDTLASFGLNFASSFSNLQPFIFNDFAIYVGSHPTYANGIILTNKSPKGAVLISFFKRTGYVPKVVVLIDNKKANIDEMTVQLQAFHPEIAFIGLEYNRGQEYSPHEIDDSSFLKWWNML